MFVRVAGLAAFVWASGQAGGQAAANHGIDAGIASIVCAAIAGLVAVAVALISRRGDRNAADDDHELVKWALEVAMRAQLAAAAGDHETAEEQRLLGDHLTGELDKRRRAEG